jgi:hypothetical protein
MIYILLKDVIRKEQDDINKYDSAPLVWDSL